MFYQGYFHISLVGLSSKKLVPCHSPIKSARAEKVEAYDAGKVALLATVAGIRLLPWCS